MPVAADATEHVVPLRQPGVGRVDQSHARDAHLHRLVGPDFVRDSFDRPCAPSHGRVGAAAHRRHPRVDLALESRLVLHLDLDVDGGGLIRRVAAQLHAPAAANDVDPPLQVVERVFPRLGADHRLVGVERQPVGERAAQRPRVVCQLDPFVDRVFVEHGQPQRVVVGDLEQRSHRRGERCVVVVWHAERRLELEVGRRPVVVARPAGLDRGAGGRLAKSDTHLGSLALLRHPRDLDSGLALGDPDVGSQQPACDLDRAAVVPFTFTQLLAYYRHRRLQQRQRCGPARVGVGHVCGRSPGRAAGAPGLVRRGCGARLSCGFLPAWRGSP